MKLIWAQKMKYTDNIKDDLSEIQHAKIMCILSVGYGNLSLYSYNVFVVFLNYIFIFIWSFFA